MLCRFKHRKVVGLFVIASLINLGLLYLYYTPSPKRLAGDENYYFEYASRVALGQRVPYTLLWPPLYGEIVGALFATFGIQRIVVQCVQIGLWLASAWFFYQIVARLFSARGAAYTALALFLLSPELMAFSHYLWPETLHLFLWILALWLLVTRPRRYPATALAGALLGLAALTKLLLIPFVPVLIAFVFLHNRGRFGLRRRLIDAAVLTTATAALTLPTMFFNLITRGEFIIADSSVFNIWIGLNDTASVDYVNDIAGQEINVYLQSGADLETRNAAYWAKIGEKVRQQGLFDTVMNQLGKQYFRLFDYHTFFTTQLPGGGRQAYGAEPHGLPTLLRLYSLLTYSFILIAGTAGLCFIRTRPLDWPHLFILFIGYNLGIFLFSHVKTRYVIQFMPMLIFFASISLHAFLRTRGPIGAGGPGFAFTKGRAAAGVALGVVMGLLMFRSGL